MTAISHHYSSQKSMMTGDEGKPTDPAEITFDYFSQEAKKNCKYKKNNYMRRKKGEITGFFSYLSIKTKT